MIDYVVNVALSLAGIMQEPVILAEVGGSPVRNPKDGPFRPLHSVVDQWQL